MTSINQLLALRHAQRGVNSGNKQQARERAAHSRFIGNHFKDFDNLRGHLFHPQDNPAYIPTTSELKVACYLERLGWIEQVSPASWRIAQVDGIESYLHGTWLEELVFLAVEDVGADEVYLGQEIEWSVNEICGRNEIDVIARRGNLLSFTSCKAIKTKKSKASMNQLRDHLTETDYWNIHFANDDGRALLVTTADFYDELHQQRHRYPQLLARATILNVSMAGLEDLRWERLLEAVARHWM